MRVDLPKFFISYTSADGTMTIGAMGASPAEALGSLCDQFGEGLAIYYDDLQEELTRLLSSPDLAVEIERRPLPAGDPARPHQTSATTAAGETPAHPTDTTNDTAPTISAASTVTLAAEHRCAICGEPITRDRATASRVMFDEERCLGCTP